MQIKIANRAAGHFMSKLQIINLHILRIPNIQKLSDIKKLAYLLGEQAFRHAIISHPSYSLLQNKVCYAS